MKKKAKAKKVVKKAKVTKKVKTAARRKAIRKPVIAKKTNQKRVIKKETIITPSPTAPAVTPMQEVVIEKRGPRKLSSLALVAAILLLTVLCVRQCSPNLSGKSASFLHMIFGPNQPSDDLIKTEVLYPESDPNPSRIQKIELPPAPVEPTQEPTINPSEEIKVDELKVEDPETVVPEIAPPGAKLEEDCEGESVAQEGMVQNIQVINGSITITEH